MFAHVAGLVNHDANKSRYIVVCRVAQENEARQYREHIDR